MPRSSPRFDDLAAFAAVVRAGSFTRAAAQLGVSPSALSHAMRALEERLALKLLNRTTRSVAPTEAGERLYGTLAPRLEEIEAELDALVAMRGQVAGTVRITASHHALEMHVWPRLAPLLARWPDLHVEVSAEDRFIDIVAARFDIGVRLGDNVARDMIARRIAPDMRMCVTGSPAYLARCGRPRTPQELAQHNCIGRRLPTLGGMMPWEFMRDGRLFSVQVSGSYTCNSGHLAQQAALGGAGLVWLPLDAVQAALREGALEEVLHDWAAVFPGYHLYYASRNASPALNAVVQALALDSANTL